ncbi:MAG: IS66 family transposase [Kiloniellaceae bacterium]|jgi:transposase|nr:IS66 family transposase [Kiloniellaceae bacterium]
MHQAFDLARLDELPPDLRRAVEAQAEALARQSEALEMERAARRHVEAELADQKALVARLEQLVQEFKRAKFGPRSEKLDADQLALALEDIEVAIAEVREALDVRDAGRRRESKSRRTGTLIALPKEFPRVEQVIEPDSLACPCGCGDMVRIGEDRYQRLDLVRARYQVVVTVLPRYACAKGNAGVVQAKAPARLIEGGLPTEGLLAHVVVEKFSEHKPFYRQWQEFARHGVPVDRSALPGWAGKVSYHVAPIIDRMAEILKRSSKLFMDETTAPVLDPGRGKTKTGYLWALARDDRSWGGADPPGVVFHYAPGRGGIHAEGILEGFDGILQVDGYAGYRRLTLPGRRGGPPLVLAHCWSHARREIIKATPQNGSPIADEVLRRIAQLYGVEKEIRGQPAAERRAVRQQRSRPLVEELGIWIHAQRDRLSRKSAMGVALGYLVNHWEGLRVFLDDGRVEMDTNPVENLIRPLALTRKNALFAGHDEGARGWARLASLIATCKLNGVEPFAYMKATLEAIAAGHPQSRIDELLPWNWDDA